MKIKIATHKPDPILWLVALLCLIYALLPMALPYQYAAMPVSAAILLLGTMII